MYTFETTLINLRVLSSLESHYRLDTTETLFKIHQAANWIPVWMKRWWASQNRQTDISRIQSLYQKAIEFLKEPDEAKSARMSQYVSDSKNGLQNLKTTYTNDKTMAALIDVILDSVKMVDSENENVDENGFESA
jgi:hypothetical protein